jgi:hypothetical protein
LTIQAGVTVNLGDYQILVNGTLKTQGTDSSKIFFQATALQAAKK